MSETRMRMNEEQGTAPPSRRRGRSPLVTLGLIVALLAVLVWRSGALAPPEVPPLDDWVPTPVISESVAPWPGYTAPDFTASDLDGRKVKLSDLRGRGVFLNFWATWCGPCRKEIPAIGRLAKQVSKDVVILTVASDSTEADVREFLARSPAKIPVVVDSSQELGAKYEVHAIPTTLLIDPRGVVAKRIAGERAWDHPEFVSWMAKLAAKQP